MTAHGVPSQGSISVGGMEVNGVISKLEQLLESLVKWLREDKWLLKTLDGNLSVKYEYNL